MKTRTKVKLSLIANKTSRKATFKKRKRGIMKKLNELVTICDVKACAVVYSPFDSIMEAWPSREGVREVFSRFMELSMLQRTKNMVDQETYIWERIRKEKEQVEKLHNENRQFELRESMFDCLKGKLMEYNFCDASDTQDLRFFIDRYVNELTRRVDVLKENDAAAVTAPIGFCDHFHQYYHMNMQNQNQQAHVQYQVPSDFYNHIRYQNMNQQEPIQYQTDPANFNDQNHNMNQNSNQYPNQQQLFMDQLIAHPQQMCYAKESESIPLMDGNHYRYQQPPTTGHIPSITTTSTSTFTADLFASNMF